jgi:hypothetical protein
LTLPQSEDDTARLRGARQIDAEVLGPFAGVCAFYKSTVQRNRYRIPIREPERIGWKPGSDGSGFGYS